MTKEQTLKISHEIAKVFQDNGITEDDDEVCSLLYGMSRFSAKSVLSWDDGDAEFLADLEMELE